MSIMSIILFNVFRNDPPSMDQILDYFQKPGVEDHSADALEVLAFLNKNYPDKLKPFFELAYKREFETKPVNKNTFLSECFFTVFRGKMKSSELPVEVWKVFDVHNMSPDFLNICLSNWSTTMHIRGVQSQNSSVNELLQCYAEWRHYINTPPDRPAPKPPELPPLPPRPHAKTSDNVEASQSSTPKMPERPQKPLPKTPTRQSSPENLRVNLLKNKFEEANRGRAPSAGKGTKPA